MEFFNNRIGHTTRFKLRKIRKSLVINVLIWSKISSAPMVIQHYFSLSVVYFMHNKFVILNVLLLIIIYFK
jgi:hypothetical protein